MRQSKASVLQAFHQAHARLFEEMNALEKVADGSHDEGVGAFIARLDKLRGRILDHFSFEEQDGYMESVRVRHPHLERKIATLEVEHGELARALDQLIAQASLAQSLADGLRSEAHKWIAAVRSHEARENELVQEAFVQDAGGAQD